MIHGNVSRRCRFFGFFSLCVFSTLGVALAGNLITFLIFYELLTLATYPLIVHKGDEDRGQILIKHYVHGEGARIFAQTRDMDDQLIWHQPLGDDFMEEMKADEYIKRQIGFDEDLWVLEIDDPKDCYAPE